MITAIDKNTALVLIDLQKGIIRRETAHPVKDVIGKAVILLDAFHKAGLPVVVVNVNPAGSAFQRTRKEVYPAMGTLPSDFTAIVDEIKTHPNNIYITKNTWNAFFSTPLHDELQKQNITGIVLGGVSTSIGVEGTARAAGELGYNITFATDAMTDTNKDAHYNSIKNIFPRLGETGSAAELIEKLNKR